MPLESCMILLDNSEYMRNGDYVPTRMEAQHDAANLLVNHKTQSNPESTVGVIAMSGGSGSTGSAAGAELLVSPTDDMGKILSALHGVPIRGKGLEAASGVDIPASVQVASLALKHRRNKNGAQKVVLFVGSPLTEVEGRALARAGRQLKKNNVSIDVVAMGELEENEAKLRELVDAANGSSGGGDDGERTCNLVTIPPGVLPSDVLVTSPIVHGGSGGGGAAAAAAGAAGAASGGDGGGGGDGFADFGGVDPNMDPELAMALRVSMEEERARQERVTATAAAAAEQQQEEGKEELKEDNDGAGMEVDGEGSPVEGSVPAVAAVGAAAGASAGAGMVTEMPDDEDALLQRALAMSMQEHATGEENEGVEVPMETEESAAGAGGDEDEDEDAAMQMALQMSMQAEAEDSVKDTETKGGEAPVAASSGAEAQFQDPQFVNQLLGSLPGVDPNDPAIRSALEELNKGKKGDESDKKDKE